MLQGKGKRRYQIQHPSMRKTVITHKRHAEEKRRHPVPRQLSSMNMYLSLPEPPPLLLRIPVP
jgi:hypothetical protein